MNEGLIDKSVSEFLNDPALEKRKQHILLLHEEPEYGRMIEYYFLKNGLEKGERSVYIILEKENVESIENEKEDFGLNDTKFRREILLHLDQVQDPLDHTDSIPKIPSKYTTSLQSHR